MALLPFISASRIIICGPSSSGKSELIYNIINHSDKMFDHPISRIYYFYGMWQEKFKRNSDTVEYIEGLPTQVFLDEISYESHKLMVIDDQQMTALNSRLIADLFTKYSHHKNINVILVLQNLFHQGKFNRDISLNAHCFILFKNPRDINQIKVLSNQLGLKKSLISSYLDATSVPYSYLLIDLSPMSDSTYMLRSNILPDEHPTIYEYKE